MPSPRKYRKFTAQQKTEIVLASLKGNRSGTELCREHDISETLLRTWREHFLAAGAKRLEGKSKRGESEELREQVRRLERALGRKTLEAEVAGNSCGNGSDRACLPVPASSVAVRAGARSLKTHGDAGVMRGAVEAMKACGTLAAMVRKQWDAQGRLRFPFRGFEPKLPPSKR